VGRKVSCLSIVGKIPVLAYHCGTKVRKTMGFLGCHYSLLTSLRFCLCYIFMQPGAGPNEPTIHNTATSHLPDNSSTHLLSTYINKSPAVDPQIAWQSGPDDWRIKCTCIAPFRSETIPNTSFKHTLKGFYPIVLRSKQACSQ
jgi:hypothetical protein